ncbi:O-methyltransferase [Nocardiopsis sp. CNT312]|uniref:O-methyltransferase n=1 Tax=Nocardiopsis sp. CNT312 TaxID=1137268 RepID=UPI00048E8DAB|nr:class I SAM-dependent methyltransferase [Nocardiopsis sp. CNT312]
MRAVLRRRSFLFAAAAAVVAVVVAAPTALALLGPASPVEALLLAATALVGALVAALGLAVLRLQRAVASVPAALDRHTRLVTEALGRDRLEITRSLNTVSHRLPGPSFPRQLREIVAAQGRDDYEQQVAWTELREWLDTAPFMPSLRGWAASPDVLRTLVRHIDRLRPELVVELGSGASSVWIGYALRRAGRGRLVAIDHDAAYAELTREMVAAHGLGDVVEVRHAPLTEIEATEVEIGGETVRTADLWYDSAPLADLEGIGLVFVDGPPKPTGRLVRYPAVPVLLPRCREDAVIVLDDADRVDERAAGDRWLAEHPELRRTEEPTEKGTHVFSRKGA